MRLNNGYVLDFEDKLPKICVPLTSSDLIGLSEEAGFVKDLPADLYEWRTDGFSESFPNGLDVLKTLKRPILLTLRSAREGGKADLSPAAQEKKLLEIMELHGFELIDIELSIGEGRVKNLISKAHGKGLAVVLSKHDFGNTPSEDEMVETLCKMRELGADLPKLAVMPRSTRDVLNLLSATERASGEFAPVITMAMGDLGKISRVSGGVFGSAITFGAGENSSAPGQIAAGKLKEILRTLS